MSFELLLEEQVPLSARADAFLFIKYAEEELPDMSGELEGVFTVPLDDVIMQLTEIAQREFRLLLSYATYAASIRGPEHAAACGKFGSWQYDKERALRYVLRRAGVLGGGIHLNDIEPPMATTNFADALMDLIRQEQEVMLSYRTLYAMVDETPMDGPVEEFMGLAQEHSDHMQQMLPPPVHAAIEEKTSAVKLAADKTDAELREIGRQRGVTNLAAEAAREKGRRGERFGEVAGKVLGTTGGAFAGNKYLKGKGGAVAGMVAGYLAGGKLGKEVGTERDIRKNAHINFRAALRKLAEEESAAEGAAMPSPALNNEEELPPEAALQQEQMMQLMQDANEAQFLRDRLREAKEQMDAVNAQTQGMQQQMQQLAQDAQMKDQMIAQAQTEAEQIKQQAMQSTSQAQSTATAALNQALQAQAAHLEANQQAAVVRANEQALREGLRSLVEQDPNAGLEGQSPGTLSPPGAGPVPTMEGAPGEMPPDAAGGAPGAQPPPGAAPPAGTSGGQNQNASGQPGAVLNDPTAAQQSAVKTSSVSGVASQFVGQAIDRAKGRLPYALAGAAIGGGLSALERHVGHAGLRKKVEQLEQEPASFGQAMNLAQARSRLALGELTEKYPGPAMAAAAMLGTITGFAKGPEAVAGLQKIPERLKPIMHVVGRSL